jgi:predicted RNase H-like nuclease
VLSLLGLGVPEMAQLKRNAGEIVRHLLQANNAPVFYLPFPPRLPTHLRRPFAGI